MILGGAEVFKQTLDLADRLEVTLVEESFEADTFFPKIDAKIWKLTHEENHEKDEKNPYDFKFLTYERVDKN